MDMTGAITGSIADCAQDDLSSRTESRDRMPRRVQTETANHSRNSCHFPFWGAGDFGSFG
jgi:hypothetical protein